MLDTLILKGGPRADGAVDAGSLAESLIYYGDTHLILRPGTITTLVQDLGTDIFSEIACSGLVSVALQLQSMGTFNTQTSSRHVFNFGIWEIAAGQHSVLDPQGYMERYLREASGRRGWARRTSRRIAERARVIALHSDEQGQLSAPNSAREDIGNAGLLRRLISLVLRDKVPNYRPPHDWTCEAIPCQDGGYTLRTNLDLPAIEAEYLRSWPDDKSFNVGNLVAIMGEMHEELLIQCVLPGDLQTAPLLADALRLRINSALEHSGRNRDRLDAFEECVLPGGRKLREVVNAGELDFKEILKLREHREPFREWIRGQAPDADLVKAYVKDLSTRGFLGRLPSKTMRVMILSAISLATAAIPDPLLGAGVSIGASAFDGYLYEKLAARHWTPGMFIERLARLTGGVKGWQ